MKFSTAWLTTNRTCNNNCLWCYAKKTLRKTQIMDFEKAKIAIDELIKKGIHRIVLIGGEPTIYPHFIDLIRYINSKNIIVSIATNGRKFKDINFANEVLNAGANRIDISLKAITEKEYMENTGTYGLLEMLQGYNNLKKLGFSPTMSYVIVSDSRVKFDNLLSFLEKENISQISLQFVKPTLSLNETESILDLKKMGKFVSYIYNKMKLTKIQYSIEISFPLCLIEEEVLKYLIEEDKIFNCCHVPRGSGINLDEDFKVIPCNHFGEFPFSDIPVDFTNPSSLEELYKSPIVKHFRSTTRCYPSVKCSVCNLWEQCGGGCFTYWLCMNPNDYIK